MEDRAPTELLVDLLLLADHFQIAALTSELLKMELRGITYDICTQVLAAWEVGATNGGVLIRDSPCVNFRRHATASSKPLHAWNSKPHKSWDCCCAKLWAAPAANAAALIRHVPVLCELDRVRLIRQFIRKNETRTPTRKPHNLKHNDNRLLLVNVIASSAAHRRKWNNWTIYL
eukprot:3716923-Amphidinium_carterae.1